MTRELAPKRAASTGGKLRALAISTPPWHRLALAAVLILSALLNLLWLPSEGYANTYYAAAVQSMLQSWRNFFFVSFDPGGFIALDKPPLGFWLQTAFARLLGFDGVALALPQALAGIAGNRCPRFDPGRATANFHLFDCGGAERGRPRR